jgi:hypothetical protein
MIMYNCGINRLLVFDRNKNGAAPIFTVPENDVKFGTVSGTVKIGAASIFLVSNPRFCYPTSLYD